ncbi:hypothetical protein E5D57_011374 [Metarhizium anisopliae]|nr:hypothetical protein E5D57_011374 [Metarhizium anisopliae]
MRLASSLGLFTSLVAAVPGLDVGAGVEGLLTVDLNLFPDSVLAARCDECCPTTIRTVISKIYCDPPYTNGYESTEGTNTEQIPKLKGRTHGCRTTTVTSWATTTATKTVTGIESVVTTITVPQETTIHDTHTVVHSTTIWVPTTYTETKTVVSEHPVTLTVDNTKYTTKSTTIVTTFVSTVITSFPVVTTLTLPGQTITAPGQTITAPGQTITAPGQTITAPGQTITAPGETVTAPGHDVTQTLAGPTVTAPGQTSTITLPGVTKTLPASTIVTTQIRTLPPSTVHVTDDQETKTITRPGYTVIETSILTLPPTTIEKPATTVTVTPMFDVSLCPTPTGVSTPLDAKSNRTFGCEPGYVCNPPKPNGCNLWPKPPSDDFLCDPNDCIPSPPFAKVEWQECETGYYPPSYGYFNLDPEGFGLSYDIFEYKVINETINGHPSMITTGNWGSQSSLTAWPKPSPPASHGQMRKRINDHKACHKSKRDIVVPSICYKPCNEAYLIALSTGKTDGLCDRDSKFRAAEVSCSNCIKANANSNSTSTGEAQKEPFEQFINFCGGTKAEKPPTASPTTPEQLVTQQPTIGTSTQVDVSHPAFTPILSSENIASSAPSTPSPTSSVGSTNSMGSTNSVGSTPASDASSSQTTHSAPPSSGQSSPISTPPGSSTIGSSGVQRPGTSTGGETYSPTTTHRTAVGTTGGSGSSSSRLSNTVVESSLGFPSASASTSAPASASASGPSSKIGHGSGTNPGSSESTSNANAGNGGSGQPGATTEGAPGNPPTSTPPVVTAAASHLSSLFYSAGAILVSSVLIMMF